MSRYYDNFLFIKDERGDYEFVDCKKRSHRTWATTENWTNYDKNDKIIVFVYQGKILGDTFFFTLAFTTKENFDNRFSDNFDLDKICKLGSRFSSFIEVQEYLTNTFGYKKENIFEETNDTSREYNKVLGIFNM